MYGVLNGKHAFGTYGLVCLLATPATWRAAGSVNGIFFDGFGNLSDQNSDTEHGGSEITTMHETETIV